MNLISEFVLTKSAAALLPYSTKLGEEHTLVAQNGQFHVIPAPLKHIIDFNLRRNHSSLRGAKDSAAYILGSTNMNPIVMCAAQQLIWFPTEANKNITCAYIALHHVVGKPIPYNDNYTTLNLTGGLSITLPVSYNKLSNRLNQAHLLRSHTIKPLVTFDETLNSRHLMMLSDGYQVQYNLNNKKYELSNSD